MSFILRLWNISHPTPNFIVFFRRQNPAILAKMLTVFKILAVYMFIFTAHKASSALYNLQCVFSGLFAISYHGNQI